jgi:ferredoxin
MGVALVLVLGLIIGIGSLSLLLGAVESLFGKPNLKILKTEKHEGGFAFAFEWNSAKEPAKFDGVKVRLFNPSGSPAQMEVYKKFDPQEDRFAAEVDMGKAYLKILGVDNFDQTRVQVELLSSKDGITYHFEMKGSKFKNDINNATQTVAQYNEKNFGGEDRFFTGQDPIVIPQRSFIAETVPGKGAQVAIPTNPAFEAYFSNMGGAGGGGAAEAATQENFTVSKVWIEPGCIVCNACEDIYPEVFDVTADTCLIRPGAPLDDGLKIEEAAEACPVEVIKFTKA